VYCEHAERSEIKIDDVKLAILGKETPANLNPE
jgi:histone H3/H4